MSQTAAQGSLVTLLNSINSGWVVYYPDNPTSMQDAVKPSVRIYSPQLLESDVFQDYLCTVDILAATVAQAQSEGDKLLAYLTPPASRFPKMQMQPRVSTFRESGFARCNVQFLHKL